jgi:hypothetical protein
MFYATYRDIAAVLQSQYSYSACNLTSGYLVGQSANGGQFQCIGSPTSYPGLFKTIDLDSGATGPAQTIGPHGNLIPYSTADSYNSTPTNYFQRPDKRYTGGALLHYTFNEHATAYSEIQYMNDRTIAQIAPSGVLRYQYRHGQLQRPRTIAQHDKQLVRRQHGRQRLSLNRAPQHRRGPAHRRYRTYVVASRHRDTGDNRRCLAVRRERAIQ